MISFAILATFYNILAGSIFFNIGMVYIFCNCHILLFIMQGFENHVKISEKDASDSTFSIRFAQKKGFSFPINYAILHKVALRTDSVHDR